MAKFGNDRLRPSIVAVVTVSENASTERLDHRQVFLSYSSSDESLAHGIAKTLRRAGISVVDSSDIGFGQSLTSAITEGIESSDAVVILLSEETQRSEWIQLEISLAIGNALTDSSKIVLPIIIGTHRNIPLILRDIKGISVNSRTPIGQIGTAVLQALDRYAPEPNKFYLQEAIELQAKALRLARETEELSLLRRSAEAPRLAFITALALTFLTVAGIIVTLIILRNDKSTLSSVLSGVNATVAGAAIATLISQYKLLRSARPAAEDDKEMKMGGDE